MADEVAPGKPGVATTEFWLSLANKVLGLLLVVYGLKENKEVLVYVGASLAGVSSVVYTYVRGQVKTAEAAPTLASNEEPK